MGGQPTYRSDAGAKGSLSECPHLGGLEWSPGAGRQRPVGDRPDLGADQPDDRMTDGFAHTAHLPVAPLVDHEANHSW